MGKVVYLSKYLECKEINSIYEAQQKLMDIYYDDISKNIAENLDKEIMNDHPTAKELPSIFKEQAIKMGFNRMMICNKPQSK